MTINEFLAPRIIENQKRRLEQLEKLSAPDVIITQVKKNIQNPTRLIKDDFQSGKKEFTDVKIRKTAVIFSVVDNDNKCVFLFKDAKLTWMLDFQAEKIN